MYKLPDELNQVLEGKIRLIKDTVNLLLVGPVALPIKVDGKFQTFYWYSWIRSDGLPENSDELIKVLPHLSLNKYQQSSILTYGDFENSDDAFVRIHSICHTGDIFGSAKCDCGYQLKKSFQRIISQGSGAVVYLADHEGRGIGLFNKALTYILQEYDIDTVEANLLLGHDTDSRDYTEAAIILKEFRKKPIRLITNNPDKISALKALNLNVNSNITIWGGETLYNSAYIKTKVNKTGHIL